MCDGWGCDGERGYMLLGGYQTAGAMMKDEREVVRIQWGWREERRLNLMGTVPGM